MARLYSNPNSWRRGLNLGRVTNQQLERASRTPQVDVMEANEVLAEMSEAVKDRLTRRDLLEVIRITSLMRARKDKRRRPRRVSKKAFVLYRKLKLSFPSRKRKKLKAA